MSESPSAPDRPPSRIAFVGFTDFERKSLAGYFRLAAERDGRYQLVHNLTEADFLVADADHAPSVQLITITERLGETVFIGSQAPPGAVGSMRRPIDALHVMRALDVLSQREPTALAPDAPSPAPIPAQAPAAAESPAPTPTVRVAALQPRRPPAAHSALTAPRRPAPPRPPRGAQAAPPFVGPPPPMRALLVDDSAIALRFLASRLAPWWVRTDVAASSQEALEKLSQRAYDLVFLDVELGPASDLDGLALCRQIKQDELAMNATVVMVSAHHSEIDRARGSLAGCDGYLSKPLNDSELGMLLRRHGLMPPEGMPLRLSAAAHG